MMGSVAMRKSLSVALVGLMLLSLFGFYGGFVEEAEGEISYDIISNTIYVNNVDTFLFDIDSDADVPDSIFWYTPGDNTYHSAANIQINGTANLIISPSQNLNFYNTTSTIYLTVFGYMEADGGSQINTIGFNSDSGTPTPGDWGGIEFMTAQASNAILNYV
jgi:hypothetical protein